MPPRKAPVKYLSQFEDISKGEYTLLSEYTRAHDKVKIKHNVCGHIYKATANSFLHGKGCPICGIEKYASAQRKTHADFVSEISKILDEGYLLLTKYHNANTHVELTHVSCGESFEILPGNLRNGKRCPKCSAAKVGRLRRRSPLDFAREFNEKSAGEYLLLTDYEHSAKKVKVKHLKCGEDYFVIGHAFLRGERCPKCKRSLGEDSIREYLSELGVHYQEQYKDSRCRRINVLAFDFAVFRDGDLVLLIEYDGQQHYKPIEFFGGEKAFRILKESDGIKDRFCTEERIPLLRIKYDSFDDIPQIVNSALQKYYYKGDRQYD